MVHYHLPGLFEFYELYKVFLPLYRDHREYFYEWCHIGSIYGAPADCLWGGGRVGYGDNDPEEVLELAKEYGISARLTFSNSLLNQEHLSDRKCNRLCRMLEESCKAATNSEKAASSANASEDVRQSFCPENGVIVHSDLLAEYLQEHFPSLYLVSSTTKVLTEFAEFKAELARPEFRYVVPDFRINPRLEELVGLSAEEKNKVEFLCNECCWFGCRDRKACYENVSRKVLDEDCPDHVCHAPNSSEGYVFSKAMKNPGFIGIEDICKTYEPAGFSHFKIEGRSLGSALILEFLLYYMTKPEHQLEVREAIYLDNTLDLF